MAHQERWRPIPFFGHDIEIVSNLTDDSRPSSPGSSVTHQEWLRMQEEGARRYLDWSLAAAAEVIANEGFVELTCPVFDHHLVHPSP